MKTKYLFGGKNVTLTTQMVTRELKAGAVLQFIKGGRSPPSVVNFFHRPLYGWEMSVRLFAKMGQKRDVGKFTISPWLIF